MNLTNNLGLRKAEKLVVALEIVIVCFGVERRACCAAHGRRAALRSTSTVVLFREFVLLNHGAHCAVNDENTLLEGLGYRMVIETTVEVLD